MLHTKFQGHQPFGYGEEEFFKVFTINGDGGHLGHVSRAFKTSSLSQNYRCRCLPLVKKYHGNKQFYHQKSIDKH